MEKKNEVSGTFLRQSINDMKKIRSGAFSRAKYAKKSYLEEKAEEYFDEYMAGVLSVDAEDLKTFAQYVDVFAIGKRKEKLLDKIQQSAYFDVRASLCDESKSWWQKLFNKRRYNLSGKQMSEKIREFHIVKQKLEDARCYNSSAARTAYNLRSEADDYIDAYNKGIFNPTAKDRWLFRQYIMDVGNVYADSPAEKALLKLDESREEAAQPTVKPRKKFSFNWNFKKVKYVLGGVAITAVMGLGAWLGFGGNNKKQDAPKGKQPVVNVIKKLSMPKADVPATFDYSLDKFIMAENVNTAPNIQISESAGEDFYESRLNRFLSKSKKETLKANLSEQMEKGIISLPQSISPSRFLYAKTIYQKYGLQDIADEFNQALKADKKLSAETQTKLYDYVSKAGAKGLGARDMAYKLHYGKQSKTKKSLAQVMKENRANVY